MTMEKNKFNNVAGTNLYLRITLNIYDLNSLCKNRHQHNESNNKTKEDPTFAVSKEHTLPLKAIRTFGKKERRNRIRNPVNVTIISYKIDFMLKLVRKLVKDYSMLI